MLSLEYFANLELPVRDLSRPPLLSWTVLYMFWQHFPLSYLTVGIAGSTCSNFHSVANFANASLANAEPLSVITTSGIPWRTKCTLNFLITASISSCESPRLQSSWEGKSWVFSSSRAFYSNICRWCNCSHTNLVDGMCNLELVDDSFSLKTCIRMHGG